MMEVKKIKTKHIMMLILIILLTISMVNAAETNQTSTNNQDNTDQSTDSGMPLTDDNEIISHTHDIKSSEELNDLFNKSEHINGTHTIELKTENTVIEDEIYIENHDLELVFNGNGNQLTLKKNIYFSNSRITFNNIILELDEGIRNYADMYLDNVTVKNTNGYNDLLKTFQEKGYYDFNDQYNVEKTFDESQTYAMSLQNDNKLHVNNSIFTNNAGHTGAAIYSTGELSVNNTKFMDSMAKFGVIYTSRDANIENSEFINNRVLQQLILTDNISTLTNNTYRQNHIAGSSIIDNRGNNTIKNNKFEENMASYDLINNMGNMHIMESEFKNNTCSSLINSYANATIKSSIFRDNNVNTSLIAGTTIYEEGTWNLYLVGNVNVTGNKIFADNISCSVFESIDEIVNFTANNNTIYGQLTNYPHCTLNENTFIKNNTLYDPEGQYDQQYYKEIYIDGNLNYEITDKYTSQHQIKLDNIAEEVTIGEGINVTGTLVYADDTPIINHSITIRTNNETAYTFTDTQGQFIYEFRQDTAGEYDVEIFETENPETINKTTITVTNNTTSENDELPVETDKPILVFEDPVEPSVNPEDMTIAHLLPEEDDEPAQQEESIKIDDSTESTIEPENITTTSPETTITPEEPDEPTEQIKQEETIIKPDETKEPEEISYIYEEPVKEGEKHSIEPEKPVTIQTNKYKNKKTLVHMYRTYKNHKSINTVIKSGTIITLSWLNNILNTNLKNQTIQIYIGDILIYNGTITEDSSQELFRVLEEHKGEQTLKVVTSNKTYTKTINIL